MCGIYGSSKFNEFSDLYDLNSTRGEFAHGHLFLDPSTNTIETCRRPGRATYASETGTYLHLPDPISPSLEKTYELYIGHTQSPTGSVRNFTPETSHPFETNSWIVGHNGVINNYKELINTYLPDWWCDVDTSVILGLLEMYTATRHTTPEVDNIVERVLNMLHGTYGLFIYNKPMKHLYLARSGSTLHYNPNRLKFSSTPCEGLIPVPERELLRILPNDTCDMYVPVCKLTNTSSFVIF